MSLQCQRVTVEWQPLVCDVFEDTNGPRWPRAYLFVGKKVPRRARCVGDALQSVTSGAMVHRNQPAASSATASWQGAWTGLMCILDRHRVKCTQESGLDWTVWLAKSRAPATGVGSHRGCYRALAPICWHCSVLGWGPFECDEHCIRGGATGVQSHMALLPCCCCLPDSG